MVTTENIVKKKPKVKSASKRIEANPEAGSCVFLKTEIVNNKRGRDVLESKNKKSETNKSQKSAIPSSGERKLYTADNLKVKSSAMGTKKRGLEVVEECRKEKRRKMAKELAQNGERASSVQVALLPKTLTSAKEEQKFWNWGRTNVGQRRMSVEERKKLSEQILEVSRGKISQLLQGFLKKLGVDRIREENIELDIDAFAEETLMELKGIIRSFIGARAAKTTNGVQQSERKMNQKRGANSGHRSISGSTANVNMPLNLATSKCGSCDSIRCQCSIQRDYANSSTSGLCSERSLGQAHLDTSRKDYDGKIHSSSQISKSDLDSGEKFKTEASQTRASEAASRTELKRQREQERKAASRTKLKRQQEQERKAASRTELKRQWEQESKAARLALEQMERTVKIDDNLVSLKDLNGKIHSSSKISKSDLDSDGSARALARERTCSLNEPTSEEDCTPLVDVQLSPKMALHAAKLRSRYAKIILKANTFLAHGDKADLILLQKEKESLKRQQREEKFKTEATQTRASEAASRTELKRQREQERKAASRTELKKQREQERKAARLALEQMERTVEIDDNLVSLKDLNDMLRGSWSDTDPAVVLGPIEGIHVGNVLQRLGLFLKDDSMGDEVILNGDINEGEIIS